MKWKQSNSLRYVTAIYYTCVIVTVSAFSAYASSMTIPGGATVRVKSGTFGGVDDITNNGTIELVSGTLSLKGAWVNNGTFTPGSGTVAFTDDTKTGSITGNNTFYNFSCETPDKQIIIDAGSTQTIMDTLTLDGQAENTEVELRSSVSGTRFTFDVTSGDQHLAYVDVKDANASTNDVVIDPYVDSGNTDFQEATPHFIFGALAITTIATPPSTTEKEIEFYEDDTIEYDVDAESPDQNNIEYKFTLGSRTVQDFSSDDTCDFSPDADERGCMNMLINVKDSRGAEDEAAFEIAVYRNPVEP